jgi:hypothetical protein
LITKRIFRRISNERYHAKYFYFVVDTSPSIITLQSNLPQYCGMWTRMESFFDYEITSGHADKLMKEVHVTNLTS